MLELFIFWIKYNGFGTVRGTTKLIEGGHRGLQAYMPIFYYFYVFYVFLRFLKIQKVVTFYVFLPCLIRFLEHDHFNKSDPNLRGSNRIQQMNCPAVVAADLTANDRIQNRMRDFRAVYRTSWPIMGYYYNLSVSAGTITDCQSTSVCRRSVLWCLSHDNDKLWKAEVTINHWPAPRTESKVTQSFDKLFFTIYEQKP